VDAELPDVVPDLVCEEVFDVEPVLVAVLVVPEFDEESDEDDESEDEDEESEDEDEPPESLELPDWPAELFPLRELLLDWLLESLR